MVSAATTAKRFIHLDLETSDKNAVYLTISASVRIRVGIPVVQSHPELLSMSFLGKETGDKARGCSQKRRNGGKRENHRKAREGTRLGDERKETSNYLLLTKSREGKQETKGKRRTKG